MNDPIELLLTGEVKPEQTFSYIHLPVEVPEGIGRIEVEYDYDAAIASDPLLTGGNTLDIGLFDAARRRISRKWLSRLDGKCPPQSVHQHRRRHTGLYARPDSGRHMAHLSGRV